MFVKVNGIELYYEVVGNGRPLIMLHGNREDHSIFEKAAERLKEDHTIYLPDSRCHGLSGNPEKLTYNLISDDVIAFIEDLKIEKPLLLGYSDGAIAALYVAAKRSDLLSGVIAAGANSHPKGLKRYVYRGLKLKILFARDKYDYLMLNGPHFKKSDFERISVPTLIVVGERDVVKKKDTEFIASSIPKAKLMILKGEDHGSYIVASDKIADIVEKEFPVSQMEK